MSEEATSGLTIRDTVWSRMIGQRWLVRERGTDNRDCFEYYVREVSPSGVRVKFENAAGRTFWTEHDQYMPVEVLS